MAATLKTSNEDLTLDADGSGSDIKFQSNAVEKASISSAGAFTSTTIDATVLTGALPAIDGSSLTGIAGRRNMIINGAMQVAQRGTDTITSTGDVFPVDRMKLVWDTDGAFTVAQDSSVPAGFAHSLKFTATTADASLAHDQMWGFRQHIEGQNCTNLSWGTAGAKTVTLSFWTRSSLTGTFGGALKNADSSRSYPFNYTISSADTWEKKSVTIAGETTGTWLTTSGIGVQVCFGLGVGSTYSGTAGSWAAGNYLSATSATSVIGTLNATWYITGVQLELGTAATDYDHRSYGEELALCQRYFETSFDGGVSVDNTSAGGTIVAGGTNSSPTTGYVGMACVQYVVSKRAVPTVTLYDTDSPRNTGKCSRHKLGTAGGTNQHIYAGDKGTRGFSAYSASSHNATGIIFHFAADAEL